MTTTINAHRSTGKTVYLLLAVLGSIVPWAFLIQFLQQGNVSVSHFLEQVLANPVAIAIAVDLSISCLVFFYFAFSELKRMGLSHRWLTLYIGLTLGVGLSCSLPLFLYLRETQLSEGMRSAMS